MNDLTMRQKAILDFVKNRIIEDGEPPTRAEIADAFDFASTRGAQKHLQALEAKGYLSLKEGKARGIKVRPRTQAVLRSQSINVPILGRVAAGGPIGADIQSDEQLLVDRGMFSVMPDYFLQVKGDSMKDDGILEGDLVGVKRSSSAINKQIVVARINDEITIKRLKQTKTKILLLPRNPDFAPIEVPTDADFAIEGVYCGLVRKG
jgi:repressor LexA